MNRSWSVGGAITPVPHFVYVTDDQIKTPKPGEPEPEPPTEPTEPPLEDDAETSPEPVTEGDGT